MKQTVGVGLLLLSGCDAFRSARDDLARLAGPPTPPPAQARKANPPPKPPPAAPNLRGGATAASAEASAAAADAGVMLAGGGAVAGGAGSGTVTSAGAIPTGTSERDLRAMLGAPTSVEDHPPGKQWRYRDGKCTVDIQLYPDVETKQFGTLAYKVKSDDNSDEGRRLCVAQLQSRVQAYR